MHPYADLPDHCFWRRAVSTVNRHDLAPVTDVKFRIRPDSRVATVGSCFAQHISRTLSRVGFTYFVAETGANLSPAERTARQYGVFSARYGNIYTARQLRQLLEEAFGRRTPLERAWRRPDGRWVDPCRPTVEPDGFDDPAAVEAARQEHLAAVREVFERAEILIVTLGLTETWLVRADGTALPLAPGVAGGTYDPERHAFHNVTVAEVEADLREFLAALKEINRKVRVLLTVSPVPLVATHENRHVLVSTTLSKAVLRVAADTLSRAFDWVDYFPSFEIITGSYAFGMYYAEDAREVTPAGVAHAMRVFMAAYSDPPLATPALAPEEERPAADATLVCDEEAIARTRA